jgi:hypothetical protein
VHGKTGTSRARRAGIDRRVVDWRLGQLLGAGFAPESASTLAHDPRFDLHALIELVERGCPHDLAVRILTPLDGGDEDGNGGD